MLIVFLETPMMRRYGENVDVEGKIFMENRIILEKN